MVGPFHQGKKSNFFWDPNEIVKQVGLEGTEMQIWADNVYDDHSFLGFPLYPNIIAFDWANHVVLVVMSLRFMIP